VNGLRHSGGQVVAFEFGERGIENLLRAAHFAQELSGHACAEAWRERQRQPLQVMVGIHL
jgi:hypothetical protein